LYAIDGIIANRSEVNKNKGMCGSCRKLYPNCKIDVRKKFNVYM